MTNPTESDCDFEIGFDYQRLRTAGLCIPKRFDLVVVDVVTVYGAP